MPQATLGDVLRYLRRACEVQRGRELSDSQLLERFLDYREDTAFAVLVKRHGPMVLSVCRRMIGDSHAVEDVFQATFLVLARRAASIRKKASLASWLYGVTQRIALKARAKATAQRHRERRLVDMPRAEPLDDVTWQELRGVLDEEIGRLPEKCRAPIILCYFEGKSYDQAAQEELGCPKSSLASRLNRGRELLRQQLVRRGLALSAAALATALREKATAAPLGALLTINTVKAAATIAAGKAVTAGCLSARALALAEEALAGMIGIKGKLIVMALTLSFAIGGAGVAGYGNFGGNEQPAKVVEAPKQAAKSDKQPKLPPVATDIYGDPLPQGAAARLGTVRFRSGPQPHQIAFTPDGKTLAVAGRGEDFAVSLFDAITGRPVQRMSRGDFTGFGAISPDATMLLTPPGLTLVDITMNKVLRQLDNAGESTSKGNTRLVAFSPDGRLIASALPSGKGAIGVWDVASGKQLGSLEGHLSYPGAIAFSPDNKVLASSCAGDGTLRFWEAAAGKELRRFDIDKKIASTLSLTFSPDGKLLATQMKEGMVWLLPIATGQMVRPLKVDVGSTGRIAVSSDGRLAVSSVQTGMIHVIDLGSGTEIRRWQGPHSSRILTFSPDGKVLASVLGGPFESAIVHRWDTQTGKEIEEAAGHHFACQTVRFSADGKSLFSSSLDRILEWDVATGKLRRKLFETPYAAIGTALFCKSFSADGKLVTAVEYKGSQERIGVQEDSVFHIWNTASGKEFRSFKTPFRCGGSTVSPDGNYLLSSHQDGIHLWNVETGKLLQLFDNATSGGLFSSDGSVMAFRGGRGNTFEFHVWDLVANKERKAWDTGRNTMMGSLALSPDGAMLAACLATGNGDFVVSVWATATGKELTQIKTEFEVVSMSFSASGRVLALGVANRRPQPNAKAGSANFVELWELPSGQRIRRIDSPHGRVDALAFSNDGRMLATAGEDSTILTWNLADRVRSNKPAQLDGLWLDLAADASKAEPALWAMVLSPQKSLPFLREHCLVEPAAPEQLAKLITDLDSEQFAVRDKAAKDLDNLGQAAEAALRKALEKDLPLEVRRRIEQILPKRDQAAIRNLRAIEVLELIATAEARQIIQALAERSSNPRVIAAARSALVRLVGM